MNYKSTLAVSSTLATMLAMSPAAANEPAFDFISAHYQETRVSQVDLDGYELNLSTSITEDYFFRLSHSNQSANQFDFDLTKLGFGYKHYVQLDTVAYGGAGLVRSRAKFNSLSNSDSGFNVFIGARHKMSNNLELGIEAEYIDVNDDDDFVIHLQGRYWVAPNFSLVGGYAFANDDRWSFGVAFHF